MCKRTSGDIRSKEHGAVMMEMALCLFTFMLTVFMIIDVCRYAYIDMAIRRAVFEGIAKAQRSPNLLIDISVLDPGISSDKEKIDAFLDERATFINEALTNVRVLIGGSADTSSLQHFRKFKTEYAVKDAILPSIDSEAVFLRPGETAKLYNSNGSTTDEIINPIINQAAGWETIITNNPLMFGIQVEFKPILFSLIPANTKVQLKLSSTAIAEFPLGANIPPVKK